MQSVDIGENQAGQRLDKFLRKLLPEAGSGFLYRMLRKKNITLNGKKAEGSEILSPGDTVSFFFSEETYRKFRGENGKGASEHVPRSGVLLGCKVPCVHGQQVLTTKTALQLLEIIL